MSLDDRRKSTKFHAYWELLKSYKNNSYLKADHFSSINPLRLSVIIWCRNYIELFVLYGMFYRDIYVQLCRLSQHSPTRVELSWQNICCVVCCKKEQCDSSVILLDISFQTCNHGNTKQAIIYTTPLHSYITRLHRGGQRPSQDWFCLPPRLLGTP